MGTHPLLVLLLLQACFILAENRPLHHEYLLPKHYFLRWTIPNLNNHHVQPVDKKGVLGLEKGLLHSRYKDTSIKTSRKKTVLKQLFLQQSQWKKTDEGFFMQLNGKEFYNMVRGISRKRMKVKKELTNRMKMFFLNRIY
jgi:hypothetical protein